MDDQSSFRIHMETEAILGILAWCKNGHGELMHSVALQYEHDHHSQPVRKAFSHAILESVAVFVSMSEQVNILAKDYQRQGIKPLDSLHLACAVEGSADFFCTCDDRFLRRAKQLGTRMTKVVSPLELFEEIES
jgi:predicted nucleic acid-binding protein